MNNSFNHISQKLKQKRKQLLSAFPTMQPAAFMQQHAGILDDYFRESFEQSMVGPKLALYKNPYAMIALGGYGRQEQCVHSDVDILFLFQKEVPKAAADLIQEIIYPLWDLGLEVGYATRTLKECIHMSRNDPIVLTPILDARFICGMSILFSNLMDTLRKKVLKKQSQKTITWLVDQSRARHLQFGDSTYLLEPNLKEGQGGLRDYHTILWIGRIKLNIRQPRDLEYFGYMSHDEYQSTRKALSFIWNVRNRLHFKSERKSDQLYFESQIQLAESMHFVERSGQQAVEHFLGELHANMDFMKQQLLMFLSEHGYANTYSKKNRHRLSVQVEGLVANRDMLEFVSSEAVLNSPVLLVQIFEESARLKIPLSGQAKRIVSEFRHLMNNEVRTDKQVLKSFEAILREPTSTIDVLGEMLDSGCLVSLLPELKSIVNRIQYDEYHVYPVDKHSLKTVQTIRAFGTDQDTSGCEFCGNVWKGLKNQKRLLWAALLHDIGKGVPGKNHSKTGADIAQEILTGFGYSNNDIEMVSFLVEHHLLLMKTATRRDIHDEETAIICARIIKKVSRLQMLFLLTVADAVSTGQNAWSDWTMALLRDLFLKVMNILKKGELASRHAVQTIEKKQDTILASAKTPDERGRLASAFNIMSPRYILTMPANNILEDIALYQGMGNREFVWHISKDETADTRIVRICAKDRPGLFSKIAGMLTLNSLNILDAQIFTWRNNIALDIFTLKPPLDKIFEDERWAIAERNLASALAGALDLSSQLGKKRKIGSAVKPRASKRPHKVKVDNISSSFFTIIEVFTYDFPGLLFAITDALYKAGLDIWVAKISTNIDQVVDVFYVRDVHGQKIDADDQVLFIQETIFQRLPKII
jgi:[protein-PII] uridylyltransferase